MNPPANASPAPVGSLTVAIGYAGTANVNDGWKMTAPYSPRLMTRVFRPRSMSDLAAETRERSPVNWLASASLIKRTSTLSIRRDSGSRLMSIQRFMVSQATILGRGDI